MNIIPDTNFLIYCAKQRIDFVSEIERIFPKYRIILLNAVTEELKNLSKTERGRTRETIELALQLLSNLKSKRVINEKKSKFGNADEELIRFDKAGNVIATLDKELKERFKNAKILTIRQKRYLFLS